MKTKAAPRIPQRFSSLGACFLDFGFPSVDAMRQAFYRGILPAGLLIKVGEKKVVVDVEGLAEHLRGQRSRPLA